ncbi:hypothetical protein MMC25_004199 [Agyrium rufum]|nr:hypothetical protein [Agyrium rufum]
MHSTKDNAQAIRMVEVGLDAFREHFESRGGKQQQQFDIDIMRRVRVLDATMTGTVMFEIDLGDEYSNGSGSIESDDASPLAAARREILEETGLAEGDVELLPKINAGDSEGLKVDDAEEGTVWEIWDRSTGSEAERAEGGKRWVIHGFGWKLRDVIDEKEAVEKIKLNEENVDVNWVPLEEVEFEGTVDGLFESAKRVFGD